MSDSINYSALIMAVVIIGIYFYYNSEKKEKENLQNNFYLDQIAMKSADPILYKYRGREQNMSGLSAKDYYLMNKIYYQSGVLPQKLDGVTPFLSPFAEDKVTASTAKLVETEKE